jgi:hypothetical protein
VKKVSTLIFTGNWLFAKTTYGFAGTSEASIEAAISLLNQGITDKLPASPPEDDDLDPFIQEAYRDVVTAWPTRVFRDYLYQERETIKERGEAVQRIQRRVSPHPGHSSSLQSEREDEFSSVALKELRPLLKRLVRIKTILLLQVLMILFIFFTQPSFVERSARGSSRGSSKRLDDPPDDLPDLNFMSDTEKIDLLCKTVGECFTRYLLPDIYWIPNWFFFPYSANQSRMLTEIHKLLRESIPYLYSVWDTLNPNEQRSRSTSRQGTPASRSPDRTLGTSRSQNQTFGGSKTPEFLTSSGNMPVEVLLHEEEVHTDPTDLVLSGEEGLTQPVDMAIVEKQWLQEIPFKTYDDMYRFFENPDKRKVLMEHIVDRAKTVQGSKFLKFLIDLLFPIWLQHLLYLR